MLSCFSVCVFTGSDATGCLVKILLVGEADNTKKGKACTTSCAMKINSSTYNMEILGFDIESNRSLGALPVAGEFVQNVSQLNCSSGHTEKDIAKTQVSRVIGIQMKVRFLSVIPLFFSCC